MGLFEKLSISFGFNKKGNMSFLPSPEAPVVVTNTTTKCAAYPYKTLATFDLNVQAPKYEGAIPEAGITIYPMD